MTTYQFLVQCVQLGLLIYIAMMVAPNPPDKKP